MSRNHADIPEVFRRAMEEAGWTGEDEDRGRRPPPPPRNRRAGRPNRLIWLGGLFFLLLLSLNWIVTTYTEWLWFTELNYRNVWLKQWGVQVASFLIAFVLAAVFLLTNWHLARRWALRMTTPLQPQVLRYPGFTWLINGAGLFLVFLFASAAAGRWETFLLYYYRVHYGLNDPIFHRDISFYFFELPVYEFLQGWLITLFFVSLLGIVFIYAVNNLADVQQGRWRPYQTPVFRRHLAVIGACFLLLWAVGYPLNMFRLLFSPRGIVFGATYTDMNASYYALWAQFLFMIMLALALLYNVLRLDLRPILAAVGLWLLATIVLGGIYPGLLQRYSVEPNEIVLEEPYIAHNIEFTRRGFALDQIETHSFTVGEDITRQDLVDNEAALLNVRLWDYRPLQATYEQLQALRPYYQFGEIDIDRYEINGEMRQVMLAARELNKANLPAPSWVNQKLEFTHGYGIVMNPVNEVTPDGQPEFFIRDLPPQNTIPLEVDRPEVYYGELTNDAVFVGSDREEFDYPSGNDNVFSRYEGRGGVPLSNALRRLAFALRLGDINVLLSNEINTNTRVQFHRQIQNRVRHITPFLELDSDPYIVVLNGRLVWLQDAYTISANFPFSQPTPNGYNYIRNAAKVVIDAYDGTVTYYIAAPSDPIVQAYNRAFPSLFRPLAEMPAELQAHMRYPEDLFSVQAGQFLTYHMTDVRVFYNKEDLWQLPTEIYDTGEQPMEPYYVTLALPGFTEPEFLLIQPFTPAGRNNMIAWMAARNDVPNYGELFVYELPKQELVFGPVQVEGRISQEPTISQQFSLWNQAGTRVIRGNLIVIPLNQNFLYIKPVFLRSETSALPELKRVIVATQERIVMRTTLDEALAALLLAQPVAAILDAEGDVIIADEGAAVTPETPDDSPEATAVPPTRDTLSPVTDDIDELIRSANQHFEAAQAAQRNGDWATYGAELTALQRDLARLMELTGNTP